MKLNLAQSISTDFLRESLIIKRTAALTNIKAQLN